MHAISQPRTRAAARFLPCATASSSGGYGVMARGKPPRRFTGGAVALGVWLNLVWPLPAPADWNNFGGNPQRCGLTSVLGPDAAEQLWANTDDFSIISWHPVTLGDRVFAIREAGFPGAVANDILVAYDLNTGGELWRFDVPYGGNSNEEWIAWVGGANGNHVYCARGGSGRTTPVYAVDVVSGTLAWTSTDETVAGPQDGFVFAPDGDILVGDFDQILRLSADDGSQVWRTPRLCSVSGNCGVVANETGVYYAIPVVGGHRIAKLDLATGAHLYDSPLMPGFTAQNAPFLSADGNTVYFARSQSNAAVDFLYAFEDDGAALNPLWSRPIRWTTSHEHGVGPDGSIYTFLPGDEFVRLDPLSGNVINTAGVLSPIGVGLSPRTAVSADGIVYVSNGWANTPSTNARTWAFAPDLGAPLFTLNLDNQNSGGPSLGAHGTLIVADRVGVYAYRTEAGACDGCDADCSGAVDLDDIAAFVSALLGEADNCSACQADANGDTAIDGRDVAAFVDCLLAT